MYRRNLPFKPKPLPKNMTEQGSDANPRVVRQLWRQGGGAAKGEAGQAACLQGHRGPVQAEQGDEAGAGQVYGPGTGF